MRHIVQYIYVIMFKRIFWNNPTAVTDCLRFHWSEKANYHIIKIYWFTRLVFGLNQSASMLEGTIKIHFENYIEMFRELTERE